MTDSGTYFTASVTLHKMTPYIHSVNLPSTFFCKSLSSCHVKFDSLNENAFDSAIRKGKGKLDVICAKKVALNLVSLPYWGDFVSHYFRVYLNYLDHQKSFCIRNHFTEASE